MAKAELAAAGNIIEVELCDHFMCSCKTGFGDKNPHWVTVGSPHINETDMSTPLTFENSDEKASTIDVNGVVSPRKLEEAYNSCDGPVILGSGTIVCGALDQLNRRKRYDGREEIRT